MTKEEVIAHLNPYRTTPVTVNVTCNYNIPIFKKATYSFYFKCQELGITWDSNGDILGNDFDCSIYSLFEECNLDVGELREEMEGIIFSAKNALDIKDFLKDFNNYSHSFDIDFVDLDWRKDYQFCAASDEMELSVIFKQETKFVIQWTKPKYVLSLEVDGETNDYDLAKVPGKNGIYRFQTIGSEVQSRLEKIAIYYSQFGFYFDTLIPDIVRACVLGRSYITHLQKNVRPVSAITDEEKSNDGSIVPDQIDCGYENEAALANNNNSVGSTVSEIVGGIVSGIVTGVTIANAIAELCCPSCGSILVRTDEETGYHYCHKCHYCWKD